MLGNVGYPRSAPPLALLLVARLQMADEQRAGVLEVFFGVGFGGGDVGKGFVEEGDDAALFLDRWVIDLL